MKIVIISLFRQGFGGGAGRIAHEMAHDFAKYQDVVLICPAERTALYRDATGLQVFGIESAGDGELAVPRLSQRNISRLFNFLSQFQPDVIHAHDPAMLGLVGQIWAKMHHVPFVYTAHILPSKTLRFGLDDMARFLTSSLASSMIKPFISNFLANCDAVIALNRSAMDDLRQFGYRGQMFVIPNGRDLKRFRSCGFANISTPEKVLGFIGHISLRKNQLFLLEALTHLPKHYRLQLIGRPLTERYAEQIETFIQANALHNVQLIGQVAHDEIPGYLERMHLFVSASTMEVQSLVIIEALASGTPVICLSNETTEELVDEAVGRRLPADATPQQFAHCIEAICQMSPAEYEAMCQRARQRVAHLDFANMRALTFQAYRALKSKSVPDTRERSERLVRAIAWIPSAQVRQALIRRLRERQIPLDLAPRPIARSRLSSTFQTLGRLPTSTWLSLGLTLAFSGLAYLFLRPTRFFSRSVRQGD